MVCGKSGKLYTAYIARGRGLWCSRCGYGPSTAARRDCCEAGLHSVHSQVRRDEQRVCISPLYNPLYDTSVR